MLAIVLASVVSAPALAEEVSGAELPASDVGTRIIGERETAAGLFVTPWKDQPASTMDLTPQPYDVPLQSVDIERFRRLADYDRASRDYILEQSLQSR